MGEEADERQAPGSEQPPAGQTAGGDQPACGGRRGRRAGRGRGRGSGQGQKRAERNAVRAADAKRRDRARVAMRKERRQLEAAAAQASSDVGQVDAGAAGACNMDGQLAGSDAQGERGGGSEKRKRVGPGAGHKTHKRAKGGSAVSDCSGGGDGNGGGGTGAKGGVGDGKRKGNAAHKPIYGNYRGYYSYRLRAGRNSDDPRFSSLSTAWFSGRRVLDVGCNEGLVSLRVAADLGASAVLGVDIDEVLVRKAYGNRRGAINKLRDTLKKEAARAVADQHQAAHASACAQVSTGAQRQVDVGGDSASLQGTQNHASAANQLYGGSPPPPPQQQQQQQHHHHHHHQQQVEEEEEEVNGDGNLQSQSRGGKQQTQKHGGASSAAMDTTATSVHARLAALRAVHFRHEDFTTSLTEACSQDVVLALSVSKWLHLHGGDVAMRNFFRKVHDTLTPGGLFVLEPQPWKSYQQYFRLTDHIYATTTDKVRGDRLKLRPEAFAAYLRDEVGFERVEELAPPEAGDGDGNSVGGFASRPLLLCTKSIKPSRESMQVQMAMVPRALYRGEGGGGERTARSKAWRAS